MAYTSPDHFDSSILHEQVRSTYDRVARDPQGEFHFNRGPEFAARILAYNKDELAALPEIATTRFAGVGNPILIGDSDRSLGAIRSGQTVLDHACGAGLDVLLAARRVGPSGKVIGVDMTPAMRDCAMLAAEQAGVASCVNIMAGVYEELPVNDASADVVISNGVINLAPDKHRVFAEITRVLRPGGLLFLADVIVQQELSLASRRDPTLWAACVGGALVEGELEQLALQAGLRDGRVVRRFNAFYRTGAEEKVAKRLFIHGVNFVARKPERS